MKTATTYSVDSLKRLLGERLKQERIARDLTQQQCAYEAGISLRTQVRLEKGETDSLTALIQVMQVLGLEDPLLRLIPDRIASPLAKSKVDGSSGKPRQRVRSRAAISKSKSTTWTGFKDQVTFEDGD